MILVVRDLTSLTNLQRCQTAAHMEREIEILSEDMVTGCAVNFCELFHGIYTLPNKNLFVAPHLAASLYFLQYLVGRLS